jgi:hypothetical protein
MGQAHPGSEPCRKQFSPTVRFEARDQISAAQGRWCWKKTKRIRAATCTNNLKRGPVAGTMDQIRPQPCFGTARSTCAWMTLRFSNCIRQVRVAVTPIEKLADLGACDAIFSHLLHGLAAEIRIASVRMLRHHVEPLY